MIVSVKELFPGRGGEDNIDRLFDHTRVFEVITDNPTDDETVALDTPLLPRNGEPHHKNPFAVMIRIAGIQSEEDPTHWTAICEYSSEVPIAQAREGLQFDGGGNPIAPGVGPGGGPTERESNPLLRPPVWGTTWEQTKEPVSKTRAGAPAPIGGWSFVADGDGRYDILNSAGDPFDPPVERDRAYMIVTVQKNYAMNDPLLSFSSQAAIVNSTNAAAWHGMGIDTLKVIAFDVASAQQNNFWYAAATIRIKVNPDGWARKVIDQGYNTKATITSLNPTGKRPIMIRDEETGEMKETDQPQLLDGEGAVLPVGDPLVYLNYEVDDRIDFASTFGF